MRTHGILPVRVDRKKQTGAERHRLRGAEFCGRRERLLERGQRLPIRVTTVNDIATIDRRGRTDGHLSVDSHGTRIGGGFLEAAARSHHTSHQPPNVIVFSVEMFPLPL
jgi:hypothetical protein